MNFIEFYVFIMVHRKNKQDLILVLIIISNSFFNTYLVVNPEKPYILV
jgi:hypothetical protein